MLHAAELVHQEDAVAAPDPRLQEEDRALGIQPDRDRHRDQQRRQEDDARDGQHQIEPALDGAAAEIERRMRHRQSVAAGKAADTDRAEFLELLGQDVAVDVRSLEQHRPDLPPFGRAGDHHAVDALQMDAQPVQHVRIMDVGAQIVLGGA